jgi:hypothetical protein
MFSRLGPITRNMAILLGILLVLCLAPPPWVRAQGGDHEGDKLQRLAASTGHDVAQLRLADDTSVTLLDGRRLNRLKAIDQHTGQVVGATFLGDAIVDETALRAQAAAEWRAAHGALTPDLVRSLANLGPQDRLNVAVWLVANVEALPKAEQPAAPAAALREPGGSGQPSESFAVGTDGRKRPAQPVPPGQVPAEVRVRLGQPAGNAHQAQPDTLKTAAQINQQQATMPSPTLPSDMTAQAAHDFDRKNLAALSAQITPIRARFLDHLSTLDLVADYASQTAPMVYLAGLTRRQVEALATWPEIDAIYEVHNLGGPSLAVARPTQNADLINAFGYNGTGVHVAVVEGERIDPGNPYLSVVAAYNASQPSAIHPTGVGGIIASTHPLDHGLASGVALYSANGSYIDFGTMSAALDWGSLQAAVLNNSYYWQDAGTYSSLFVMDRHMDYIVRYQYDLSTVAAGNSAQTVPYVATPGKGYNALTVGNYDDLDSLGWAGDAMNATSSFGNPGLPAHDKPEVAAVGTDIVSTLPPPANIGPIGSGTSYSSPMVAALAADLIGANSSLANKPEVVRSIIMATALHNIEGSTRLSDKDGAGGIVATAAIAALERGHWADQFIDGTTSFPLTFTQFAYQGERVRFVINWLANPNASYSADPLPADLDLVAYRADGITPVAYSLSSTNNFEIVDFIAPGSESYVFKVSLSAADWSRGGTYLGTAWWRGIDRIRPEMGYSYLAATPLGNHLAVYPGDWMPIDYWRALGIRPNNSDHDLTLYSASWFDDPGGRQLLASSLYGGSAVDLIMVDGNHWSTGQPEYFRVARFSGSEGYQASWSNQGILLYATGWYGPYTMRSDEVLKVFDVRFDAQERKQISVVPSTFTNDLAAGLFYSQSDVSSTWAQGRPAAVATADAYGPGSAVETLSYLHASDTYDYLGLVVYSKMHAGARFWIYLGDPAQASLHFLYMPLILK